MYGGRLSPAVRSQPRWCWAGCFRSVQSDPAAAPLVQSRLLSSEIIFVVDLGHTEGTGQRELGDVVLVERADVLVVGLLGLGLGLGDWQIVGDAGTEALLGLAEGFVGEFDV